MNPTEMRMMWMSQYNPERITFEDATSFYGQTPVGLSVMDDITVAQTGSIEMNPMMSIVGGEYSGQATSTLSSAPPTTLIATGPGSTDLYGITQVGGLHPVLQHSATGANVFQAYSEIIDDDDVIDTTNDDNSSHQFVHQAYDHMVDDSSCYDATGTLTNDKEIINIDDFVMMNTNDSNSYEDSNSQMIEEHSIIDQKPLTSQTSMVMTTIASTSTSTTGHKKARKIEPINRPGLVLKTPIAYKGNIDPSVIPIQRDGMAVCERCGAIGVKHTFYTKSRRFCSMACARGELQTLVCNNENKLSTSLGSSSFGTITAGGCNNNSNIGSINNDRNNGSNSNTDLELECRINRTYRFKMSDDNMSNMTTTSSTISGSQPISNGESVTNNNGSDKQQILTQKPILFRDLLPQDELPQIPKSDRLPSPCPQDDKIMSIRRKACDHLNSFDWTPELLKPDFYAAPVTCFPHAPGYDVWDNVGVDMKVEVENTDVDNSNMVPGQTPHSFWVATILKICGYKALMRYEGFDDSSHDFWVNLCSSEVHSVGWCATRGKPLIPPKSIENKYTDWKDFLVERLSGARTLPSNFYNKISDSFKSRFRCGLNLEIVDKNRISQVKLATVHKIIGKRLFVKYFDSPDDGFWCHEDSSLIHPVGWATTVGHNLVAPQDYLDRMLAGREQMIEVHEDDATVELFKMNFTFEEYYLEGKSNGFVKGMKLEAIDPLNLSSICVATVMSVLKFGYMMIKIDFYASDGTGSDWFCYHEKSPNIFPVGFCESHNIALTPPNGYDTKNFNWKMYLEETNSLSASEHLFHHHRVIPNHGFQIGMKLECADLMDPRLVCVATIARVIGRLIKVRFDGWTEEYDQWLDCESPDFYPVGWCVLVGHILEAPPIPQKQQPPNKQTIKGTKKKRRKKIKTEISGVSKYGSNRFANIKKELHDIHQNHLSDIYNVKLETRPDFNEDDDDDDEYDDDMSRSDQSTPLPITPEPGFDNQSHLHHHQQQQQLRNSNNTKLLTVSGSGSTNSTLGLQKSASTSPAPPAERKATSYINNSSITNSKYIPRLNDINNSPEPTLGAINKMQSSSSSTTSLSLLSSSSSSSSHHSGELLPETWNVYDVSQFLRVNNCTAHCDTFSRNKIDGKRLLQLTKDEIITLLGMKVGPALKIFDLIQQLKCKTNSTKSRLLKSNLSKKFL